MVKWNKLQNWHNSSSKKTQKFPFQKERWARNDQICECQRELLPGNTKRTVREVMRQGLQNTSMFIGNLSQELRLTKYHQKDAVRASIFIFVFKKAKSVTSVIIVSVISKCSNNINKADRYLSYHAEDWKKRHRWNENGKKIFHWKC